MHPTRRSIGHGNLGEIATLLTELQFGPKLILVFDVHTWLAAAQEIAQHLETGAQVTLHPLGRDPEATLERAETLIAAAREMDGLIAIGAGTINDITKYAAAQLGKPYICVATAASMNGYSATNASLASNKQKQSHPAKPPRAVLVDIKVITAAPKRLTRAGLGDTLCRSSVEVDMLLSHFLLGTPYPRALFDRLRRHEPALLTGSPKLTSNELDASFYELLMEALLDAGDAMTEHGSSAVASQGEHMIAHTADLMYGTELNRVLHGEMVGVTTITSSLLQQHMLLREPIVKPLTRASSLFLRVFGKHAAEPLEALYQKKMLTPDQATDINAKIVKHWAEIKQAITDVAIPPLTLERALVSAGVPTRPHDIKLDPDRYQHAVTYAHMSRDRFTFLDLAAMNDRRA